MYINDKIDLLVQYLLIDPFQALYSRITKREVPPCCCSLPSFATGCHACTSLHALTTAACLCVSSRRRGRHPTEAGMKA
jgi:hypothetical protein